MRLFAAQPPGGGGQFWLRIVTVDSDVQTVQPPFIPPAMLAPLASATRTPRSVPPQLLRLVHSARHRYCVSAVHPVPQAADVATAVTTGQLTFVDEPVGVIISETVSAPLLGWHAGEPDAAKAGEVRVVDAAAPASGAAASIFSIARR